MSRREGDISEIQNELSLLRLLRSENIIEYYGASIAPGTTELHVIMELAAVSAADLLLTPSGDGDEHHQHDERERGLPENCVAYILRETLNALVYLHAEHHMHRDIKAANILLTFSGDVKVSDFSAAAQLSRAFDMKRHTFVGSPLWMAPEIIQQDPDIGALTSREEGHDAASSREQDPSGNEPRPSSRATASGYDESADIWSLGITAVELAQGHPPLDGVPIVRALFQIVQGEPPTFNAIETVSTELQDFVGRCLQRDPSQRPSAIDLLMHPFVSSAEKPLDFEEMILRAFAKKSETMNAIVHEAAHIPNERVASKHEGVAASSEELMRSPTDTSSANGGWDFGTTPLGAKKTESSIFERQNESRDHNSINAKGRTLSSPVCSPSKTDAETVSEGEKVIESSEALSHVVQPAFARFSEEGRLDDVKDEGRARASAKSAYSALENLETAAPGSVATILIEMVSRMQELSNDSKMSELIEAMKTRLNSHGFESPIVGSEETNQASRRDTGCTEDIGSLGNFLLRQWAERQRNLR